MKTKIETLVMALLMIFVGHTAMADGNGKGDFAKKHPRRAQVLKRDRNLKNATNEALEDKKINGKQARKLKREENAVRQEQKDMAKANGGYITPEDQKDLNHQENRIRKQLNRDEKIDATAKTDTTGSTPVGNTGSQPSAGPSQPSAPVSNR